MNSKTLHNINYFSLLALSFVLPFHQKIIPPVAGIFFITTLINGNYSFKENKKTILLFTVIYIAYVIGLLNSANLHLAFLDLETKFSLLIFPITFYISRINMKDKLPIILKWFLFGVILSSVICLGDAVFQFMITKEESELFYSKLSIFHHPSYFSMYLNLALIIVYYFYFKPNEQFNLNSLQTISLNVFLSILIILLSSKLGIISMLFTQLFAITFGTIKHKNYYKSFIALLIIISGLSITYQYSYSFHVRVNEFFSELTSKKTSEESTTGVRIYAWNAAIKLIKEKPLLGYGTGDVKDVLVEEYLQQNLTILAEKRLNPHNQFLQTSIALGLIGGGITLILILISPLIWSFKQKHYVYVFFLLLILLNALTESILERQAGVIFYAFFNALFFSAYFSNKKQLN
ncbi:MAG: O-antigen ligase family protein [Vicingus serpentipes]|nr:O-antigen ligase family protein [Vicingus serpentipes]